MYVWIEKEDVKGLVVPVKHPGNPQGNRYKYHLIINTG